MSDKTATEHLRALLDERGVEYLDMHGIIEFRGENDRTVRCYQRPEPLTLDVAIIAAPPEQAIAATLGSCNCSNSERTGTCRLEGFADVPFSVDYEIEGYDMGSSRDYATLAECSSCGAYVIVPPEYHHVLTCDGDEVYQPYRFCPACGRRIEVDDG